MLPATTHVVQWGGSHVWKVGGKVFAVGGLGAVETCFTFKVSDLAYEMLKQLPGLRPAPYLASRGLKWIQNCLMQSFEVISANPMRWSGEACQSAQGSNSGSRTLVDRRLSAVAFGVNSVRE